MSHSQFRMLYSDIGGVLGNNGWDGQLRRALCNRFGIEQEETERRHHLIFDSYERGYLSFDEYLTKVIFGLPREFTLEHVRDFTFNASTPWFENIEFFRRIRRMNQVGIALISNEGQGIADHRVKKFGLRDICDFMVISHFTGLRKPDPEIWKLALNLAQVKASESIYIDDREMFVDAAAELGFTAVHHTDLLITKQKLAELGISEE